MGTIDSKATVGQLVAERPSRARFFEKLGIDYCCGGKVALETACAQKGLDTNTVVLAISAAEESSGAVTETDWTKAPLSALIDNIIVEHHDYLREELPRLYTYTQKIAANHPDKYPYMPEVAEVFAGFKAELEMHMAKEEQILFPMIHQIEAGNTAAGSHCGSIRNPIFVMEREHDSAGNALETMRALTQDYNVPEDACNTFRAVMDSLQTLERNMHTHVHKENSILFPRAIEAEGSPAPAPWTEAPIAV